MADYDYDEPRRHRSSHHHRDRRDDREPRYVETQETYVRAPAGAPEPPYAVRTNELIRRPDRQDSDLSIEEVRREFPPPGAGGYMQQRSMVRDDRYGPPIRSRSSERNYGGRLGDPRDERYSRRGTLVEEKEVKRRRSLSRNQKIMAGVAGAALAVGGKELFDRKKANGGEISRNALQTAAIGAAGAFAAYEGAELYSKHAAKEEKTKTYAAHRGRNGEVAEYYSSEEEEKPKSRRKSIMEGALGLAGLGGAAAAAKAAGGKDKDGKSSRSRHGSPDSGRSTKSGRSRSRGPPKGPEGAAKFQQAAKAALLAGATEAFRVRNEPGGWGGAKGKRILTAAIGAGGIDAAANKDSEQHSKRHILEAVVGGLAGNRLINGSRNNVESDDRASRARSRSRAPSSSGGGGGGGGGGAGAGLAALATAGLGALAAKKISDNRSQSRDRSRERDGGRDRRRRDDSYDSRSPSPDRRHKRSKSVSDYARKGLAALGIGEAAGAADDRKREVVEETHIHKSSRRRRSPDDDYDDRRGSPRDDGYGRFRGNPYGDSRYADSRSSVGGSRRNDARAKDGRRNRRVAEGKESDSESSLGSSSGDEKRIKKMKAHRR